jgi:transposase-like protein/DDE family transposase
MLEGSGRRSKTGLAPWSRALAERGKKSMLMRVLTPQEAQMECAVRAEQQALAQRARELLGSLPSLQEEMSAVRFGCKRLEERFARVLEAIEAAPQKSFPQQSGSYSSLVGLYRCLYNRRVTKERIIEPHVASTRERVRELGKALVIHDTTAVSLGGRGTREGMGPLGDGGHGYFLHPSLAVSADGQRVPLGVLRYETLVRQDKPQESKKPKGSKNSRKKDPESEFLRWWRAVREAAEPFKDSAVELIHLMDREGDDFMLLAKMVAAGDRFVVRLQHDRLLSLTQAQRSNDAPGKVHAALSQVQASFEREVKLSARKADRSSKKRATFPEREGRPARLQASATRLCLRRPNGLGAIDESLPRSLELNVVRVWEVDAPEGVEPLEWYLLTTEPIDSAAQIELIVDFYRARWLIEEFFKALKTGCSLEKRQLEGQHSLFNALAIFVPMAFRMLLSRTLVRTTPTLPATVALSELELQILRRSRPDLKLPEQPSIAEAYLAIAALGGHIKYNGPPGWQVLGRGFEKLLTIEEYLISTQSRARDSPAHGASVQS